MSSTELPQRIRRRTILGERHAAGRQSNAMRQMETDPSRNRARRGPPHERLHAAGAGAGEIESVACVRAFDRTGAADVLRRSSHSATRSRRGIARAFDGCSIRATRCACKAILGPPLSRSAFSAIRPAGAEGLSFFLVLNGRVRFVFGSFRISGRPSSAGVRLGKCVDCVWEDVSFDLSSEGVMAGSRWQQRVGEHLLITPRTRELSIKRVAALVDLLLEREILFLKS
jgi:hypothetical protein